MVVTACPSCQFHLADLLKDIEKPVEVKHIIQVLDEALEKAE